MVYIQRTLTMVEYRCSFCHKLLCKWEGTEFTIEIKCWNCNAIHSFGIKVDKKNSPDES